MARVLLTGVSSGIGAALADYYLNQGDEVWGLSRRAPEWTGQREGFHFVSVDLLDLESLPERLAGVFRDLQDCDLAILNAGMLSPFGDLRDTALTDCRQTLDLNLWANKMVIDGLLQHSRSVGQIVTISSGAGVTAKRGWNAYAISKAALNMLTALYGRETPGTHFLALAPGPVETPMQEYLCGLPEDERFAVLDSLKSRRHTEQMPTPAAIAPGLAAAIARAREAVESGSYIDIRNLPW